MKEIVLDLYGGDNEIENMIPGAVRALEQYQDMKLSLVLRKEDEAFVRESFQGSYEERVQFLVGDFKVLTNTDNPIMAAASGADYTVTEAVRYLKGAGENSCLISVGNTAAILILSLSVIGLMPGVTKPVLASLLPRDDDGRMCLLDCGANLEATAEDLAAFAAIGSSFVKKAYGKERPKVGLISVGKEKGKGTPKLKEAYALLEESGLNFIGNVEPDDLLVTDLDVAVCDGVTGNVILKNTEAIGKYIRSKFMRTIRAAEENNAIAGAAEENWKRVESYYSFNEYGGAVMMGINRTVVKAHGMANGETVFSCIKQTMEMQ